MSKEILIFGSVSVPKTGASCVSLSLENAVRFLDTGNGGGDSNVCESERVADCLRERVLLSTCLSVRVSV